MEEQKKYDIFTDASFDNDKKVGTYSIVVMQDQRVLKTIAKKCNVQLQNSIESEIYAVFQAINVIKGEFLKKKIAQKFHIRTDCATARDFFVNNKNKIKVFNKNTMLLNTIKQSHRNIQKRLSKKDCSFKIKWIPRENNKAAHNSAYSAFQKLKSTSLQNDSLLIEKTVFLKLLKKANPKQHKVIEYLFKNSNEEKMIIKTQNEIAKVLEISTYNINKIFKELIELNILGKVQRGQYILLV